LELPELRWLQVCHLPPSASCRCCGRASSGSTPACRHADCHHLLRSTTAKAAAAWPCTSKPHAPPVSAVTTCLIAGSGSGTVGRHRLCWAAKVQFTVPALPLQSAAAAVPPLHDGALCLAEALLLVPPSCVGHKDGKLGLHRNVVLQGDVVDLDIIEAARMGAGEGCLARVCCRPKVHAVLPLHTCISQTA
jgi:hypothetical protein